MRKKLFMPIFAIFLLFISISTVEAALGDLRYEITDLKIDNDTITFTGWAFIHKTHNFAGYAVGSNRGIEVYNENGIIKNGGQKVTIEAYKKEGKKEIHIESKSYEAYDKNTGLYEKNARKYNFYCQMYSTAENYSCTDYNYEKKSNNTCDPKQYYSQCYYEDLYFSITFDISNSKWQNVDNNDEIIFKIKATNADFVERTGKDETDSEYIYITQNANRSNSNEDSKIKIKEGTISANLKFIADPALLLKPQNVLQRVSIKNKNEEGIWGCIKEEKYIYPDIIYKDIYPAIIYTNIYPIEKIDIGYFKQGYMAPKGNKEHYPGVEKLYGTYSPGMYLVKAPDTTGSTARYNCCKNCTKTMTAAINASWVIPDGETGLTVITRRNDKKCDYSPPKTDKLECNGNKTYESTCKELTVKNKSGESTTVKITQTGIVSNVLTPTEIYNGGGFKFGIVFYHTITWDYTKDAKKIDITQAMIDKIKDEATFKESLNLVIDSKILSESDFEKVCDQRGEFTAGNTLTTVCTFYLKEEKMKPYTGEIASGSPKGSINNKKYVPLDYYKSYPINAKISEMDRITAKSATEDSKENNKSWTGNWEDTFTCQINIKEILTKKISKSKFQFIYRPIDLNNPFPNRNAGINWYTWYKNSSNQDRLKDTYKNLQYSITIDDKKNADIKAYNKKRETYFDWDSMKNNKSQFIDAFDFTTKRKNIKEGEE